MTCHRDRWAAVILVGLVMVTLTVGCSKKSGDFKPGGKWMDNMRTAINDNVFDTDRAAKMLAIIDQIEGDLEALDQALHVFYRDYTTLDMDYNTTRQQFEDLFADFAEKRLEYRDGLVDARFRLTELATREEWKKLSDVDETIYQEWRRTYDLSTSVKKGED